MAPDIDAATQLLRDGKIWNAVKGRVMQEQYVFKLCLRFVMWGIGYVEAVKGFLDLESRAPSPTSTALRTTEAAAALLINTSLADQGSDSVQPASKKHCPDHFHHTQAVQ